MTGWVLLAGALLGGTLLVATGVKYVQLSVANNAELREQAELGLTHEDYVYVNPQADIYSNGTTTILGEDMPEELRP